MEEVDEETEKFAPRNVSMGLGGVCAAVPVVVLRFSITLCVAGSIVFSVRVVVWLMLPLPEVNIDAFVLSVLGA
jgi:hypothetical protein